MLDGPRLVNSKGEPSDHSKHPLPFSARLRYRQRLPLIGGLKQGGVPVENEAEPERDALPLRPKKAPLRERMEVAPAPYAATPQESALVAPYYACGGVTSSSSVGMGG